MPMDPDAARLMELVALSGRPPLDAMSPAAARAAYRGSHKVLQRPPPDVAEWRALSVAGLPARLYRGIGAEGGNALLYLHGGGWVIGDLESHDGLCRTLANAARCQVVALDYRLAPEHRFPAALDDAAAAYAELRAGAASLGFDPARLAVGGDSAGGHLAALLAIRARDRGSPAPAMQLLLYPATDLTCSLPSHGKFPAGVPLTGEGVRWFRDHFLGGADPADPGISPLFANLAGLPAAFVLTAGYDPLCDEGSAYARALEAAGCAVTHLHMAAQVHGFLSMNRAIRAADTALAMAAGWLRHGWGGA